MNKVLLFIVFIIIFVGCAGIRYPEPLDQNRLHIAAYIDASFSPMEENIIINALKDWQCSTHEIFVSKINLKYHEEEYSYITDLEHSLIITKGTSNNSIIKSLDADIHSNDGIQRHVVGVYIYNEEYVPRIILVEDRLNIYNYYAVTAHEIGHALGLEHSDITGTLMFPYMDQASKKITQEDLEDFCKAYRCNANDLRVCK